MSTEVPEPTEAPPPAEAIAPAPPVESAPTLPPESPSRNNMLVVVIAIVVALAIGGYGISQLSFGGGRAATSTAYSVQPYTPPTHIVSARDHVLAHAHPDITSPTVVMFGPGVALNVTGRVSRGIGDDWYAVSWNGQTAFVRQADTMAGEEAPPVAAPHPDQPEIAKKPEEESDDIFADTNFPEPPPVASGPLDLGDVDWVRAPNARDFARFYPHRALDQGRSGRVVLDCIASANGALNCSVAEENPRGLGFGDAAVSISRQTRIEPTLPDGRSVAGGHLRVPMQFRAG